MAERRPHLGGAYGRGDLPGRHQCHQGDGRLRQHRVRPTRRRHRVGEARPDGLRNGHHDASRRQPGRGDRRPADRGDAAGDGRRVRDSCQRRHSLPATILDKVVFPDGSVDNLGNTRPSAYSPTARPMPAPRFSRGSSPAEPAPPPGTAAPPRARPGPPTTWTTPGSSATPRGCRRRSGSASRKGTSRWPTASAAPSRRRSGTTTCRRRAAATAGTSRRRATSVRGHRVLRHDSAATDVEHRYHDAPAQRGTPTPRRHDHIADDGNGADRRRTGRGDRQPPPSPPGNAPATAPTAAPGASHERQGGGGADLRRQLR